MWAKSLCTNDSLTVFPGVSAAEFVAAPTAGPWYEETVHQTPGIKSLDCNYCSKYVDSYL